MIFQYQGDATQYWVIGEAGEKMLVVDNWHAIKLLEDSLLDIFDTSRVLVETCHNGFGLDRDVKTVERWVEKAVRASMLFKVVDHRLINRPIMPAVSVQSTMESAAMVVEHLSDLELLRTSRKAPYMVRPFWPDLKAWFAAGYLAVSDGG